MIFFPADVCLHRIEAIYHIVDAIFAVSCRIAERKESLKFF